MTHLSGTTASELEREIADEPPDTPGLMARAPGPLPVLKAPAFTPVPVFFPFGGKGRSLVDDQDESEPAGKRRHVG